MADDQNLEVFHVHVQHVCGRHAQRLQNTVGGFLIGEGRQGQYICDHIGVKPDGRRRAAAPFLVGLVKMVSLFV
jgi:hypothetical protein